MGLGMENMIKNMDPGMKKLFGNIISICFLAIVLYAMLSLVFLHGLNFMGFLTSSDFVTVIMVGFFLYMGWSILSGKKLNIPQQKPQEKKTFKPKPIKRRPPIQRQEPQQMEEIIIEEKKTTKRVPKQQNNPVIRGSWRCPKCEFLVVGSSRCPKCGFQRRR